MAVSYHNTTRVLSTTLFLFFVSLFLTSYSAKNRVAINLGSAAISDLFRPLQTVSSNTQAAVANVWNSYIGLRGANDENSRLKERLAALESENAKLREVEHENKRLQSLLGGAERDNVKGIAATVIAYDPGNWSQVVTIDKGSESGVQPEMAVVAGNGVVGQVIVAGDSTARVLLITDRSSGVDVMAQDSRVRGIAEGTSESFLRWAYVLSDQQVQVGDKVVTSGLDGVFPKGLLVGVVSQTAEQRREKLFREIDLTPSVDLSRLEEVLVVTPHRGKDQ